ncbi:MAG: PDZ domain-containing protein [Planctomycetaceae bacterium]|nr:PDZ domain-containing protein [Planctomycetaceae bacterium]
MARRWIGAAVMAMAIAPQILRAQQALEDLERKLTQPTSSGVPQLAPPSERGGPRSATSDEPGYLGIIADDRDSAGRGVRLLDVLAAGPAAIGGLQVGDVITSIDGVAVDSLDGMADVMTNRVVGEEVTFVVLRNGEVKQFDVVLTKRPPPEQRRFQNFGRIQQEGVDVVVPGDPGATPSVMPTPTQRAIPHPEATPINVPQLPPPQTPAPNGATASAPAVGPVVVNPNGRAATAARTGLLGIRTVRITPELQLAMNLPEPRGALVVEVRPDSPAREAGIPIDAVITAIDGTIVNEPNDLAAVVQQRGAGAEVRLSFYRYGQLYERRVKLVAPPSIVAAPAVPQETAVPTPVDPPATAPVVPAPSKREPAPSATVKQADEARAAEEKRIRERIEQLEKELQELKKSL